MGKDPEAAAAKQKENNERQGKKAHKKTKANLLNRDEAYAELKRLRKGNHQNSKYYGHILLVHPVLESLIRKETA